MAGQNTAEGGQGGGLMGTLIMFVPLALIFYFLIIRPQKKQQKEHQAMIEGLQKNDYVQLSSGILGKITKIDSEKSIISIEIDKNTHTVIDVVKSSVVGKVNEQGEK
ncbi:preprotein translocase subunit YajC [bacterium]|nr:preprotein translocase subunit YajC [bacterium]